jgi:hypothetical protein
MMLSMNGREGSGGYACFRKKKRKNKSQGHQLNDMDTSAMLLDPDLLQPH